MVNYFVKAFIGGVQFFKDRLPSFCDINLSTPMLYDISLSAFRLLYGPSTFAISLTVVLLS